MADATFGYQVRQGLILSLSMDNLFDKNFAEMPGLPERGRLVLVKAKVEF